MIEVQSRLGLRAGELLGLRDVDVNGEVGEVGEVKVTGQITGNSRVRVAPKTPKSRRILYLPPDVGQVLAEHVARWGVGDDGLLFVSERGGPYSAQGYGRLFGKAVAAAGIEQRNPGAWTSHDLRHHYASVMLANGLPPVAVAEWLGHDDGGVLVMSTYGHLMPSSEDKMREVQATAWA